MTMAAITTARAQYLAMTESTGDDRQRIGGEP
jgi:hypothetical protein